MPRFTIETQARADISEVWEIEAADADEARMLFEEAPDGQIAVLISDRVEGGEEDREITRIDPVEDKPLAVAPPPPAPTGLRTFEFDYARDGDLFGEDIIAASREDAEKQAVEVLNYAWNENHASWAAMAEAGDGCDLIEHPTVMGERVPAAFMARVAALLRGLGEVFDTTDPDSPLYLDSGADTIQALCEHESEVRGVLAAIDADSLIGEPIPDFKPLASEMTAVALDMLCNHVYDEDQAIPADCGYLAGIQKALAALGLPPAEVETAHVCQHCGEDRGMGPGGEPANPCGNCNGFNA